MINSVIANNRGSTGSGGIFAGAPPINPVPNVITNCTIYRNTSDGVTASGRTTITNSIVRNSSRFEIRVSGPSTLTVTYCNIEDGYAGAGNIDLVPQWVAPDDGDETVQGVSRPAAQDPLAPSGGASVASRG